MCRIWNGTLRGATLNFYEAYIEKKKNKWTKLKVQFAVAPEEPIKNASKNYKKFLKIYFGHFSVRSGEESPRIGLFLESDKPAMTFQGHPLNNTIFTNKVEMLYPKINRVLLTLKFRSEKPAAATFQQLAKKYKIETDEDYLDKMHLFAAEPKFAVTTRPKMPNFSYAEFRLSKKEKWQKVKGTDFNWDAEKTINQLEVRGVNKYGRPGPVTFVKISFK